MLRTAGLSGPPELEPLECLPPPPSPELGHPQDALLPVFTLASITAEKKVPKSSVGCRQAGESPGGELPGPEEGSPCHTPVPSVLPCPCLHSDSRAPIPSATRWATHIAYFDPAVLLQQPPFDLRPQRAGHIQAGAGGALLAPVLEGRAQRPAHHAVHVGRAMHEVEVLSAAL